MSAEVATRNHSTVLSIAPEQSEFSENQVAVLRQLGVKDASRADLAVFFHQSVKTGLDPFARQIYLVGRWTKDGVKQTIQTGIDGYRLVAHRAADRAGEALGYEDTLWCGQDGIWQDVWLSDEPPHAAKVAVHRGSTRYPAVAHWAEYVQTTKDGNPNAMWGRMKANQLAKCFSEDTEVLTEFGYRRFADVGVARIMQVTGGGLEAVAATPFVQNYGGLMIELANEHLDFSVTPNHNMVTTFGIVEAGAMYATSRTTRPTWSIPRLAPTAMGPGLDMTDDAIRLAAVIVADGTRASGGNWRVEVSRPAKAAVLDALGMASDRYVRGTKGDEATSRKSGRVVRSNFDKQGYRYSSELVAVLVDEGKQLRTESIRAMNTKQARLLVDTLVEFDGTTNRKTGVRRFYSSEDATRGAFELAAAIAGYTTNVPRARVSDLSDRPNWCITISDRDAMSFRRGTDSLLGLTMGPNASGRVWCVTVPSGQIMVRRNGFAMVCGNCAEALALRKAFPQDLSGVYTEDEIRDERPVRRAGVSDAVASMNASLQYAGEVQAKAEPPDIDPNEPGTITTQQSKRMHALFTEKGFKDRDDYLSFAGSIAEADLATTNQLSMMEANSVIDALVKLSDPQPAPMDA